MHPQVSDLAQSEVFAQGLDLLLAIAADWEDRILSSMVEILAAGLQMANSHGRVKAVPCHG